MSHPQRCQRNNFQRKEERLHPRLLCTAARTPQYCQQTQKMEFCPIDDNIAAYNKSKAEFTRQKFQQTRAAWQEKTSSLNMKKDTGKLWKLTKLLNGEIPEKAQTVLQSEGELIVQREAANCLAKLLELFNESWKNGTVPAFWDKSHHHPSP